MTWRRVRDGERLRAAVLLGMLVVLGVLWSGTAWPGTSRADAPFPHPGGAAARTPEVSTTDTCQVGDVESRITEAETDPETGVSTATLVVSARWAMVSCLVGALPERASFTDAEGAALRTSVTLDDAAAAEPVVLDAEHAVAIDLRWHGIDAGSAQGSPAVRPAFLHVWLPGLAGPVGGRWEHGPVYNTGVIEMSAVRTA